MSFYRTEENIYYLHPYYPTRYVEHSGVSESIIAFKQGNKISIDRFTKEMKESLLEELRNDSSGFKGMCLVVIPSHSVGRWSKPLLQMAKELCQELNILDYSYALERIGEHEKLTIGGDRSIASHFATMNLNPICDVKSKKVIVLDDVATTGNSLKASARILKNAGAEQVHAIVIGKTFFGTSLSAF